MEPGFASSPEPPLWAPWYGIGFGRAVVRFFRKMKMLDGRASRSEYWWAVLFCMIVASIVVVAAMGIGIAAGVSDAAGGADGESPLDTIADNAATVAQLLLFIPTITLSVRRLHDANRSGRWLLLPILLQLGSLLPVFVITVVYGYDDASGSGHAGAPAVVVGLLLAFACYTLGSLAWVILMVLPSDPRGMRFDRPDVVAVAGMAGMPAGGAPATVAPAVIAPAADGAGRTGWAGSAGQTDRADGVR